MKNIDVLYKKVQELCSKCIALKRENDMLLKENAEMKSKMESFEERERAAKKLNQQNEDLLKQKNEMQSRLKNLLDRIDNAIH